MNSPELLYNGDKRLDTLEQAIMEVINERARDQGIPYLSLIGLLDSIKFQILLDHENRAGESPAASTISWDDQLVWDTPTGTTLFATRTLHMEGEEDRDPVFTEGRGYRVISMHPIACPAFVKVIDDQGTDHMLEGQHIRAWFSRVSPNAKTNAPPSGGRVQ